VVPFFINLKTQIMNTLTTRISKEEFKETLEGFAGSENHYLHRLPGGLSCKLTDGAMYAREYGDAYWLFDAIVSWQVKLKNCPFQVWDLIKQGNGSWFIQCTDGNAHVLAAQEINYTDFPIPEITLWLVDGVCMLPNEY
jgi:hypothetical protein